MCMHPPTVLFLLVLVGVTACASCNSPAPQPKADAPRFTQITIERPDNEPLSVHAEVVATRERRLKGLMFREKLPEGEGMLFVFESESPRDFWMKNTMIHLDILFINRSGEIVGIVHNAEPQKEKLLGVDAPSTYVLEVPGGWCAENGVHRGMTLRFDL